MAVAYTGFSGTTFRGANIVPRPTDSGNGDFGVPACYYDLIYDWAKEDASDPWTNWIKPQIDALHSVGGNLVRFMFDITLRYGDASHHGAATWRGTITLGEMTACLDQLITYLDSLGMYLYGTAAEMRPLIAAGIVSGPTINAYTEEYVGIVSSTSYTNVVACDLYQEWDYQGPSGNVIADNLASIITIAKAARGRLIPLTMSTNGAGDVGGVNTIVTSRFPQMNTAGFDYFDIHLYYFLGTTDLDAAFANAQGKAVVINETGIPYTGTFSTAGVTGSSAALRTDMYDRIVAAALRQNPQSVCTWSIAPNYIGNQSNDYGMFGLTAGTLPLVARTELTDRFQLLPVTISVAGSIRFPVR